MAFHARSSHRPYRGSKGIEYKRSQQLTESQKRICRNVGVPMEGNAAGSTDWFNLATQNKQKNSISPGFTAKGYVAFVFSCVVGVLGLITITVYGLMDMKNIEERVIEDLNIEPQALLEEADEDEPIETGEVPVTADAFDDVKRECKSGDHRVIQAVSSRSS